LRERLLYDLLRETARAYPDKLAVICGDTRLSYEELKNRIDRLANGLRSLGIQKNEKIAILHKNCHRFLEVYFATAKIGAVLVPMNYRLSAEDFIYILDNSQAKFLITQVDLVPPLLKSVDVLPHLERIIFTRSPAESDLASNGNSDSILKPDKRNLDYESLLGRALAEEFEKAPNDGENKDVVRDPDIAQLYYTSGTTGKPKGVILTHQNNRIHAKSAVKELGLSPEDRWLHVSPMFHLADAWAVWAITQAGGTHVMVPGFDPECVLDAIEEHSVTLSNFIPTMLNILVKSPGIRNYNFSSLRVILSGGAPIAKEVVRQVIDVFGCDYIQTYGLTETSPFLTMSILQDKMKELPFEERLKYMVSTGRPFYGVDLKVVREDGTEVSSDGQEVGEILAKGDTITPGYWQMPEETSQRIVNGWLGTRDLAVVDPSGYITIVDRKDDVIISGGENIYSVEVDDVLYAHPGILEAAVIGLPNPIWGEKVTAVVVLKEGKNIHEEELLSFCKERIASFKAPKKVIFTDRLPKTGSAKICKYKLREKFDRKYKEWDDEKRVKKRP